jgi:putative transposase
MTHHLGYEKHSPEGKNSGNSRNGKSRKTLKGKQGEIPIEVPRDRNGEFDPQFVKKRQTRFDGFDDKIISLYARGMTSSEIQGHLEEIYGVEISPELISTVTDGVIEEVRAWQGRPLEKTYVILYLDALVVKVKQDGRCRSGNGSERCNNSRLYSKAECRCPKTSTGHLHRKADTLAPVLIIRVLSRYTLLQAPTY